ncbi:M28 family peptidase [Flammeovirga sp. SubArs3]|uniref:M28 family peptidase n=1 Tax=Flammeovirga sp. SubArs3 TaxID=2995316 RepID=UPI00248BA6C8|nr:M28 family peptidase [Flammeovirga sp. SubArs3]
MKKTNLLAALTFAFTSMNAQDIKLESNAEDVQKYMNTITQEELKGHLSILASDEYEGRETGERGQKMAADYIAKHFMNKGLVGPVKDNPNPYFQQFDLYNQKYTNFTISANGKSAKLFDDIFPYGNFTIKEDVELIFVGFGDSTKTFDDYAGVDVKGKGVIFFQDSPDEYGPEAKVNGLRRKAKYAAEKGAAFAIILPESDEKFNTQTSRYASYLKKGRLTFNKPQKSNEQNSFGLVLGKPSTFMEVLGLDESKFNKAIAKSLKKQESPKHTTFKVSIDAEFSTMRVPTENVLGFMEGTDLKDEVLVVTSHYDHVGIIDGKIHNGADDDGSGTTGVLEIVDAFAQAKKDGKGPRRSILFMTVTGEEKGLLGSEYYSEHPIFPMEKTIADLNVDMIGRGDDAHKDQPNFVYVIGSDMLSSDLHSIHTQVSQTYKSDLALDYTYNEKNDPNRYYYRSDHYNFAKHGVPVIFYFNGTHEDYHQPTDTVDKIAFGPMQNRAQLIFATAWELAHRDKAPVVDKEDNGSK